jgi:hypothetical protein
MNWHPSGWSQVFGPDGDLLGYTSLTINLDRVELSRPVEGHPDGATAITGEALRIARDGYWAFQILEGPARDLPSFAPAGPDGDRPATKDEFAG